MRINAANQLTVLRLILIPFFLSCVIHDNLYSRIAALLIFILASLTDLWDGQIARARNLVTTLGTFLDPLADKLLISAAFIAFVQVDDFYVPAWMVVLIIGREFFITGLRTQAAAHGRILPAQPAGKFKTTSQIVTIIALLLMMIVNSAMEQFGVPHTAVGEPNGLWWVIIWILNWGPLFLTFGVTILTVLSGYIYLRNNIDLFNEDTPKVH